MSTGNGDGFKSADTSKIPAPQLLQQALHTEGLPVTARYLRDHIVSSRRTPTGGEVVVAVDEALAKSLRGPIDRQRLVAFLVVVPAPQEEPLIVQPGDSRLLVPR